MLTKTRSVLKHEGGFGRPDGAWFMARDEDTGLSTRTLVLSPQDFRDLGEPTEVTVTIEPGDRLNP